MSIWISLKEYKFIALLAESASRALRGIDKSKNMKGFKVFKYTLNFLKLVRVLYWITLLGSEASEMVLFAIHSKAALLDTLGVHQS